LEPGFQRIDKAASLIDVSTLLVLGQWRCCSRIATAQVNLGGDRVQLILG
jgi:hypothetical protein